MVFTLIDHPRPGHLRVIALGALLAALVISLAACTRESAPPGSSAIDHQALDAAFLRSTIEFAGPVPTAAFSPPANQRPATNRLNGTLRSIGPLKPSNIEVLKDAWGLAPDQALAIRQLPSFNFEFVQDGNDIIPVRRGPLPTGHPYWELILEPGKAWDDPADDGWTRVSLPFSLQERNQNCLHNGMLTFVFRSAGDISRVVYQVVSETCRYLQANLWGVLDAVYMPGEVAGAEATIAKFRWEVSARLPVRKIEDLERDYPGVNHAAFVPAGIDHNTVFGFVIDDIHYRGGCNTRYGAHPFCDVLDIPSYSLAKGIFAGLVFMYLEKNHPGFSDTPVTDLVPECRLQDGRWDGVSLWHLMNMTTGNYDSPAFDADESAEKAGEFFLSETHAGKIAFSCTAHPRRSPPGARFVYHTWDTYLLGTAMNAFWKKQHGRAADIFRDIMVQQFWEPMGLSPVALTTRRTYDDEAQPFTGYGLTWHPDDAARIGQRLVSMLTSGEYDKLDASEFEAAMFRDPGTIRHWADARGEAYSNGFWGLDAAPLIGCKDPVWVPFLSAYGGINIALIPNGTVYYDFEDGNRYRFREAVAESHKIRPLCEAQQR